MHASVSSVRIIIRKKHSAFSFFALEEDSAFHTEGVKNAPGLVNNPMRPICLSHSSYASGEQTLSRYSQTDALPPTNAKLSQKRSPSLQDD